MKIKIDPTMKRKILKNRIFNRLLISELDEEILTIKGYSKTEIIEAINELVSEKKAVRFTNQKDL